jgi:hypothetical protein
MRRITVVILHAFVAQGQANERAADQLANSIAIRMQNSLEKAVGKLVDTLLDRAVHSDSMYNTQMDNTALGKPAQLALPQSRSLSPPLPSRTSHISHVLPQGFHVPVLPKPDKHYAPAFSKSCPSTDYTLYTQLRRQHGLAPLKAADDVGSTTLDDIEAPPTPPGTGAQAMDPSMMECDLNNLDACSASNLEVMYIDALYEYYANGKAAMADEEFDRLKMELNWQGSGVPTLRRSEIKFVEASIAYARGEPILSDDEYEKLKTEIKANGKRQEVTQFLLYVKGMKSLDPDQFSKFQSSMEGQGMSISPTGAECVLSDTPETLQNDVLDTIQMYTALGVVPTTICTGAYYLLSFFLGGTDLMVGDAVPGLAVAGLSSVGLTAQLVRYLGLTSPQILKGVCPCCESEIRQFASDFTGKQVVAKCGVCKTQVGFNAETLLIEDAGGLKYMNSPASMPDSGKSLQRDWDILINKAALKAVQGVAGQSIGENLAGMKPPPAAKPGPPKRKIGTATSQMQVWQDGVGEGIFAWAVLLGYGIFGEKFVGTVRGKGIAIHSGTINDFCNRFAMPVVLRQKYIQTAKRNGHDLGFLVQGEKQFGNGLFGEQAMKWWKAQGF